MKKGMVKHQLSGLMALLLFSVFAVCVLSVLLMGASAYQGLTQRDQEIYSRRTCTQYVATKVRQNDRLSGIYVEEFEGVKCLSLYEEIELDEYVTRIYFYDGYIRELYSSVLDDLSLEAGEQVMEAQGLDFVLEDGLLTITTTGPDGVESTLTLSLRGGEGDLAQ